MSEASIGLNQAVAEEYFKYRASKIKSQKSEYWIRKSITDFLKFSNYTVDRDKLLEFQNWYKANYGFEVQAKYHSNLRNFLEWLYKKTGDSTFREMKEVLEPPKKNSKKLNPILLREVDIHNLVLAVWRQEKDPYFKLKHITGILFAAYTGQRPQSTISKLTVEELQEAISRKPPVLHIPEEKDKENFPHWVPLHPIVVEWLRAYLEVFRENEEDEELRNIAFSYYSMRKMFDKINVKAVHTGRKITFSHLRKFFEQMCNNVLTVQLPDGRVVPAVHPGLRDYIMAHNTGSLDVQSYDGKLPSEIYEQYMAAWGEVNLVPSGVSIKNLLVSIDT